jgi:hypothetical protein
MLTHTEQQGSYHHVTGVDASSSAALAAYINTLTQSPYDKTNKVVSGLYWYAYHFWYESNILTVTAVTMPFLGWICVFR